MPEGLIALGVSAVQIFASIFANLLFESARDKAADRVKGQMVHAEQFKRVVQTDINEVKEKINSMSQSRIYAAFDYVKRGLIILQGAAPQRTLSRLAGQNCNGSAAGVSPSDSAIVDYGKYAADYERLKGELAGVIKDAERFFVQADVWATEAFNDKNNVPAHLRLECVRIQLFSALMMHWEKPDQWLGLWRNIFVNTICDRGVVQAVLSFNPWLSRQQKNAIKLTLASVVNEAVCSLWKIAHSNISAALTASQLLHFIRAPRSVLHDKHHEAWRNAIGLPMNSFTPWNGRLVVIIPDCFRICPISNNVLCVIDKQFKIKLVDSVTLVLVKLANDPFAENSPLFGKEFACLAYDHVDELIMATQFDPNDELRLFRHDVQNNCLDLMQTVQLPEPGYFITCTNSTGRWVFRSASGNVYLKDRGPRPHWLLVARNVSKIFDALDEPESNIVNLYNLTINGSLSNLNPTDALTSPLGGEPSYCRSYGVRLLADFKITSYYRNPDSCDSQDAFFVKRSRSIDLKSVLSTTVKNGEMIRDMRQNDNLIEDHFIQNIITFDRKSPQSVIVAQKLQNGRLKLSKIEWEDDHDRSKLTVEHSSLLPYYLKQSIEELIVSDDDVIYLATGRGIELSDLAAENSVSIARTLRRLSSHLRIKSNDS